MQQNNVFTPRVIEMLKKREREMDADHIPMSDLASEEAIEVAIFTKKTLGHLPN